MPPKPLRSGLCADHLPVIPEVMRHLRARSLSDDDFGGSQLLTEHATRLGAGLAEQYAIISDAVHRFDFAAALDGLSDARVVAALRRIDPNRFRAALPTGVAEGSLGSDFQRTHLIEQTRIVPFALAGGAEDQTTAWVDHEGGGQTFDGIALHHRGVEIQRNRKIDRRLGQETRDGFGIFTHIHGNHRDALVGDLIMGTLHGRHLGAAGWAPGRPEVQDHGFAQMVRETLGLTDRSQKVERWRPDLPGERCQGLGCVRGKAGGRDKQGTSPEKVVRTTHGL